MQDFDSIFFTLNTNQNSIDLKKNLDKLNFFLKSSGAKAEIYTEGDSLNKVSLLRVFCSVEDYAKKAKRRAGRPEIFNEKMTIGEALDLRKTHTMDEIAQMAGISRRTLYRKLNKYKNMKGMTL